MTAAHRVLDELVAVATAAGRTTLFEHEALALAAALGLEAPRHVVIESAQELAGLDLAELGSSRLVVKALAVDAAHKTELGAVAIARATQAELASTIADMAARLEGKLEVAGYLILEFVEHDHEPGGELLLSLRHSREFGPLVTLGLGGVTAETLGSGLAPGAGPLILSAGLVADLDDAAGLAWIESLLRAHPLLGLLTGSLRGRAGRTSVEPLASLLHSMCSFAVAAMPGQLRELEINPLSLVAGRPVVLDSLARVAPADASSQTQATGAARLPRAARPLDQAAGMLTPKSLCVMGVSSRGQNPGRIILRNTLAAGFDRERLLILRPGAGADDTIDGVACAPDFEALIERLGGPVDLLALAIAAEQVPATIDELCATGAARGVVLIPGGLGERAGTGDVARGLAETIERARRAGTLPVPVVNGGNCLGLRSLPGRVDTLFIPHEKLPLPRPEDADPVAILSQSGAFAIARISSLGGSDHDGPSPQSIDRTRQTWGLAPRTVVTMGNQLDLTMADWLEVVEADAEVHTVGCYVEGFQSGDGLAFCRVVRRMAKSGRRVVLYRAGKSPEGAAASASHTASLAGDPIATRALVEAAGGLFAESIEDFEDALRLAAAFAGKPAHGRRLGVLSNAGFECVAIADNLGTGRAGQVADSHRRAGLVLADLTEATRGKLEGLFDEARLSGFVDVHHPLDVTPIADDKTFARATELLLEDPSVDIGLIGCVPLSGAISSLPEACSSSNPEGLAARMIDVAARCPKPFAVVVDSGPLYDTFATALARGGIPVFRTADRATRALALHAVELPATAAAR